MFGPYGNARDSQGTINTAKGYTEQYNDSLTGLDYYNSRYYDQVAGVFLSADVKQGNLQGMNPYAYVGGDPETFNDPTGQMFVLPGGGAKVTQQDQQAYDYHYATSTSLGEIGLPALLDLYLYHHDVWAQAETYAQYSLHTSTQMLLGLEASTLVHSRAIDWNASQQRQLLFLKLNGLAMSIVIAAVGLGMHGSEMATAEDLARVASQSERAINENEPVTLRDGGDPVASPR